jgi:hypothetical protein
MGLFLPTSEIVNLAKAFCHTLVSNPSNPNPRPSETGLNVNNFAETRSSVWYKSNLLIIPLITELMSLNEIDLLQLFLQ